MDKIWVILSAAVEIIFGCIIIVAAGHCMMTAILHIITRMYM